MRIGSDRGSAHLHEVILHLLVELLCRALRAIASAAAPAPTAAAPSAARAKLPPVRRAPDAPVNQLLMHAVAAPGRGGATERLKIRAGCMFGAAVQLSDLPSEASVRAASGSAPSCATTTATSPPTCRGCVASSRSTAACLSNTTAARCGR